MNLCTRDAVGKTKPNERYSAGFMGLGMRHQGFVHIQNRRSGSNTLRWVLLSEFPYGSIYPGGNTCGNSRRVSPKQSLGIRGNSFFDEAETFVFTVEVIKFGFLKI